MNANDRREQILDFVNKNHDVSFAAIRELLPEVSEMTIRRDLECLSKDNKIIRVLGGAKSVGSLMITSEDAYVKRSNVQAKSKVIIAQKALKLITGVCAMEPRKGDQVSAKTFRNYGSYGIRCSYEEFIGKESLPRE